MADITAGPDSGSNGAPLTPTYWFFLDAKNQHTGPYIASAFKDLLAGGHASGATLVWAEGRGGWHPLQDVPELWAEVSAAAVEAATAASGSEAAGTSAQKPSAPVAATASRPAAAVKAAKAVKADIKPADRELAAFQAEMSALGATDAPTADEDASLPDLAPGRVETPPPDERRFEDDDGTIFVWDALLRRFVEEGITEVAPGQASAALPAYGVEDMTFEIEEEKIPVYRPPKEDDEDEDGAGPSTSAGGEANGAGAGAAEAAGDEPVAERKMGAAEAVIEKHKERAKRAREAEEEKWKELKVITSVYVTGLPDDVTEAELAQVFTKCGILKEDDDGRPRVKIYRDKATGMVKGDGLVSYLKPPSVDLACKILDGAPFRDDPARTLTVQPAKFEMRGEQFVPKKKPNKKKPKKDASKVDKALGWGGFDDQLNPTKVTVVLKHMFSPAELLEEPSLKEDLETDTLAECTKLGPVEKVRVYPNHPDGIVSIKFRSEEAAEACLKLMHGRFFGGRQVAASLWDGIANYNVKRKETPEEEAARLERFAAEIEAQ